MDDNEIHYYEKVKCPCCYVRKTSLDVTLECFEPGSNIGHYCDGKIYPECLKYIERLKSREE